MLPREIAVESVTRLRGSSTTDDWNDAHISWTSPTSATITGCSVQAAAGSENLTARNAVEWRAQLFLNPDADVKPHDRIVHGGITYEVDGPVPLVKDPGGQLDHKWCFLRYVEG